MNRLLERNAALLTDPRGFTVFILATLVAFVAVRQSLFTGISGDDSEQLIFSQFFAWGYQVRNPPLFTWLLMGVQEMTGPTSLSVIALRMMVLAAIYLLTLRIGQRLLCDQRLAPLAAGALLAVFYLAWNTIYGFSISALVTLFYVLAVWALLRLEASASWTNYAVFGIVAGLGLLAKYAFAIFLIALISAALMDGALRRRILNIRLVLGLVLAAAIVFPQAEWYAAHADPQLLKYERELSFSENAVRSAKGIGRLMVAFVAFLMPLGAIGAVVFWPALRRRQPISDRPLRYARLLERTGLIILGLAVISVVAFKSDRIRTHYMFFLALFPLYFFLRYGARIAAKEIKLFAAVVTLAAITIPTAMLGKYLIEPLICGHCEDHIPYDDFAEDLRAAGFKEGTIYAYFHRDPLPGNFRTRFPASRVVSAKHPGALPPPRKEPGQCLLIWPVIGAVDPKSVTIRTANAVLNTKLSFETPSTVLTGMLPPYGRRPHRVEFILIEGGKGDCR